jgi:glycine cleavage system aminomethyltransferase T
LSGTELSALYVPMPGDHGQLEVLTRVLERQSDRCLVTTSPEQATRLGEWLRVHVPGHLRVLDQTSAYACFELRGPGRTAALEQLASESSVQVAAHEDAINDSTVITVPSDSAVYVSDRLCAHRQGINLRWGGHFAEEMLRIARGVPSFGRDIGPATLIAELGRSALPDSRPGRRVPSTHRSYVLAAFSSPMPQLGFGARDVILDQGRIVGELLSRARLPGWSASLSLGRVEACVWQRQALQTMVDGHSWRLSPRESAWDAVLRGSDP